MVDQPLSKSVREILDWVKWGGRIHPKGGWHCSKGWGLGLNTKEKVSVSCSQPDLEENHCRWQETGWYPKDHSIPKARRLAQCSLCCIFRLKLHWGNCLPSCDTRTKETRRETMRQTHDPVVGWQMSLQGNWLKLLSFLPFLILHWEAQFTQPSPEAKSYML